MVSAKRVYHNCAFLDKQCFTLHVVKQQMGKPLLHQSVAWRLKCTAVKHLPPLLSTRWQHKASLTVTVIGVASDSRFEAIVDEIMHFRSPSCAHHSTLNVPVSLYNKPLVLVLSHFNASCFNNISKCVVVCSLCFTFKCFYL